MDSTWLMNIINININKWVKNKKVAVQFSRYFLLDTLDHSMGFAVQTTPTTKKLACKDNIKLIIKN